MDFWWIKAFIIYHSWSTVVMITRQTYRQTVSITVQPHPPPARFWGVVINNYRAIVRGPTLNGRQTRASKLLSGVSQAMNAVWFIYNDTGPRGTADLPGLTILHSYILYRWRAVSKHSCMARRIYNHCERARLNALKIKMTRRISPGNCHRPEPVWFKLLIFSSYSYSYS